MKPTEIIAITIDEDYIPNFREKLKEGFVVIDIIRNIQNKDVIVMEK